MQRVDAIDHLFERSAGNDPREHGVGIEDLAGSRSTARATTPRPVPSRATSRFVRQHPAGVPAFGKRAAQIVGMPAGACVEYGDVHLHRLPHLERGTSRALQLGHPSAVRNRQSKSDARSTSGSSRPAWNVRPLVALVSQTSAGLKSIGSIL